ncbi:MAG: DGQHR domain-containing protein [Candidatus Paceibacteria bacterium]
MHVDYGLDDAQLQDLDPGGSTGSTVIISEITGRSSKGDVKSKLRRFKDHFNTLRNCEHDRSFWQALGVPDDNIHHYLGLSNFKGFFITNQFSEYDISLPDINNIVNLYDNHWSRLRQYSSLIGRYSKRHFLDKLGVVDNLITEKQLVIDEDQSLSTNRYRHISGHIDSFAHIYRFDISPYDILPISRVARRDNLPSSNDEDGKDYQRPLIEDKIKSIRGILKNNRKFLFPNNILCVLSKECSYNKCEDNLIIPYKYGSITVIDGQHRLYSYADDTIEKLLTHPLVPVAAVMFKDESQDIVDSHSAHLFLEINANQTRIELKNLEVISYEVLGNTDKNSLATKILKDVNDNDDGPLYGFFDIYGRGDGFFKIGTIRRKLRQITSLDKIDDLSNAERGNRFQKRSGYENLFNNDIVDLSNPDILIDSGTSMISQYFSRFKYQFNHDWPTKDIPQRDQRTILSLAKSFAALIRLLEYFIENGYDWDDVNESFESIKYNVKSLRGTDKYSEENSPLLDKGSEDIPSSDTSTMNFFRFFRDNITEPTSISDVSS